MSLDHEARKKSLGASEVAAVLGCNENMTALDVWLVKTGRKPPFEGNDHTRRGNRQEAQILEWLAEDLGVGGYASFDSSISGVCERSKIATATPDGYVCIDGKIESCEAKSTLKNIHDIEDIPVTWLIQCQWQMLCTGLKKAHLAIFGPMVSNYQRFEIDYNEAFASELLAQAEEWWQVHIVGDKEPDPMNEADILKLYPQSNSQSIEAVPMLYESICKMNELKAKAKDIADQIDQLRQRIVLAIGPNEIVKYGGRKIASYKTDKRGIRILRTI